MNSRIARYAVAVVVGAAISRLLVGGSLLGSVAIIAVSLALAALFDWAFVV